MIYLVLRFVGTANSTSIETMASDDVNGYMRAGLATAVGGATLVSIWMAMLGLMPFTYLPIICFR